MKSFALIGAAGYIAPTHMKAIKETGNTLVAALDKHDSVGILDSFFPNADFFTEFERFDRHLEKLKRNGHPVDYVVVCSPNYLHDAHIRFGLRLGADVICEKPVVLNPWNVEALREMEKETGKHIYTILQLRLHPAIIALRDKVLNEPKKKYNVRLEYITPRGNWYQVSWKGDKQKSGGIASNIGVHFFDLLLWIFGPVHDSSVGQYSDKTASGTLMMEKADVSWLLSIDSALLPNKVKIKGERHYRFLVIDGEQVDFSEMGDRLHMQSYVEILKGNGFGLSDAGSSIQLLHDIRNQHLYPNQNLSL